MRFPKIDNVILFGGARLLAEFAGYLRKNRWKAVVFSSPRHLEEAVRADGTTLAEHLTALGVAYYSTDDINTDARVASHLNDGSLGIALGAAWTFEKAITARFAGRLLDFMGIRLPEYRGGAHYTWQILAGNRRGACNLQVILGGAETFHRGPVLKSREYAFPAACRIPLDYFEHAVSQELKFLGAFLREVRAGGSFTPRALDESRASFFPFLHTKTHGLIDWGWSAEEIDRFVRAFDDPYAGASTFVEGRKVHLKSSSLEPTTEKFHPFHAGLVYRLHAGTVYVAAWGGALRFGRVLDADGEDASSGLRLGDRLRTPGNMLEDALAFGARYGARGVEKR